MSSQNIQIKLNGEPYEIESGCSVEGLLRLIAGEKSKAESSPTSNSAVAVELNGEILPRNEFGQTELHRDDAVEVVTLVGGG